MMSSILVVECFRSHFTDVHEIDTLLVSHLIAVFAHGYILHVKSEYQVLVVHTKLAHFAMVVAFLENMKRWIKYLQMTDLPYKPGDVS